MIHVPVLLKELKALLNLKKGDTVIDATLDGGGHARMLARAVGQTGRVMGIERDQEILKNIDLPANIKSVCGNFADIKALADYAGIEEANAILFDLGLSSWQLERSGRGFSFQNRDEPLLMNFGKDVLKIAADILNTYSESQLFKLFKEYGEEPKSGYVARSILKARRKKRIISVGDFLDALKIYDKKTLARIFQALRIEVNCELENLKLGLDGAFQLLKMNGRLAAISYHSLEDRVVKNLFMEKRKSGEARMFFKKPITAGSEEILKNARARSAKLRILEKI